MLTKAQQAFTGFCDVDWLVWRAVLMPALAKEAEEEQKLAEVKELAELAAKEAKEWKIAKTAKVEALLECHLAEEINDEVLESGLQALDEEYGPNEMPTVLSDEEEGSAGTMQDVENFSNCFYIVCCLGSFSSYPFS